MTTEFQKKLHAFLDQVNDYKTQFNTEHGFTLSQNDTVITAGGTKYLKLVTDNGNRVWGFVSLADGTLKGAPVKVGDLLKAATWRAPAKHSRGNILDGTAKFGPWGPNYL